MLAAALLAIAVSPLHSFLGEKYILMRLFRQPLPELFGNGALTRQTLRFAWRLPSIAWFGFAAIVLLHYGDVTGPDLLALIGTTFGIAGAIALRASRGKHLSWIVFWTITVLCLSAAFSS